MPNHAPNKPLRTAEGPHFSGLISGAWVRRMARYRMDSRA
jgi:hypothetical protein